LKNKENIIDKNGKLVSPNKWYTIIMYSDDSKTWNCYDDDKWVVMDKNGILSDEN